MAAKKPTIVKTGAVSSAESGLKPPKVITRLNFRSDRVGAYPAQGRIFTPADICATVYRCLGIDPHTEITDQAGRPVRLTQGEPMAELF